MPARRKTSDVVEESPQIVVGDPVPNVPPAAVTTASANPYPVVDEDKVREEFNEHVKALVDNFVEQKISGLEQRITDLETTLSAQIMGENVLGAMAEGVEEYSAPSLGLREVPEYTPLHQSGDGVEWYRGN